MSDISKEIELGKIPVEAGRIGEKNAYATSIAMLLLTNPDFKYMMAANTLYDAKITGERLVDIFEKCGQNLTVLVDVASQLRFGKVEDIDSYLNSVKESPKR